MTDEGRAELQQTIEDLVVLNRAQAWLVSVLIFAALEAPGSEGITPQSLLRAGWYQARAKAQEEGTWKQILRGMKFTQGRIDAERSTDAALLADALAIVEEAAKSAVLDPEDRTQGEQSRPEGKT